MSRNSQNHQYRWAIGRAETHLAAQQSLARQLVSMDRSCVAIEDVGHSFAQCAVAHFNTRVGGSPRRRRALGL